MKKNPYSVVPQLKFFAAKALVKNKQDEQAGINPAAQRIIHEVKPLLRFYDTLQNSHQQISFLETTPNDEVTLVKKRLDNEISNSTLIKIMLVIMGYLFANLCFDLPLISGFAGEAIVILFLAGLGLAITTVPTLFERLPLRVAIAELDKICFDSKCDLAIMKECSPFKQTIRSIRPACKTLNNATDKPNALVALKQLVEGYNEQLADSPYFDPDEDKRDNYEPQI